jgi:hypothetical protein
VVPTLLRVLLASETPTRVHRNWAFVVHRREPVVGVREEAAMRTAVATALALVCLQASAQAQPDNRITGCVASATGSLYAVRMGDTPAYPCQKKDNKISWSIAGPQGSPGTSIPKHLGLTVSCPEESINDALAVQADSLNILIKGTCVEAVEISRDDVTLRGEVTEPGQAATATITAPQGAGSAILIKGGHRVILQDLSLEGGTFTLNADSGTFLRADNLRIKDASGAGLMTTGVTTVSNSRIENNGTGVNAGGSLVLENCSVVNNSHIGVGFGGSVQLTHTTVAGSQIGIYAENGTVNCFHCTIRENGLAVSLGTSSFYSGFATIEDNQRGIEAWGGSVVVLDNATVHGSVSANLGSVVSVMSESTIAGGTEPGITLGDTCTAEVAETSSVTGSPGVFCTPSPSLAHLKWPWPSDVTTTNCPVPNP